MYRICIKRILDFILSLAALIILSPIMLLLMATGAVMMKGNPFFTQKRPGKNEKIFNMVKFRTMSNAKNEDGSYLPDSIRLNKYGKFLRSTSLDELPELWNILTGDMAIVGPRPQLVKDMVFMTDEQRRRHTVRPGLTGLAQINGRNSISWEEKFQWDLKYIQNGISFRSDLIIILKTVAKVLEHSGIVRDGTASDLDLGDYLLENGKISGSTYSRLLAEADRLTNSL